MEFRTIPNYNEYKVKQPFNILEFKLEEKLRKNIWIKN